MYYPRHRQTSDLGTRIDVMFGRDYASCTHMLFRLVYHKFRPQIRTLVETSDASFAVGTPTLPTSLLLVFKNCIATLLIAALNLLSVYYHLKLLGSWNAIVDLRVLYRLILSF